MSAVTDGTSTVVQQPADCHSHAHGVCDWVTRLEGSVLSSALSTALTAPSDSAAATEPSPSPPLVKPLHGDLQPTAIEVVTGPVLRDWPAALAAHRRRIVLNQPLTRVRPIGPGDARADRPPGELGCFAAGAIEPGTVVGQYQGWVGLESEFEDYALELYMAGATRSLDAGKKKDPKKDEREVFWCPLPEAYAVSLKTRLFGELPLVVCALGIGNHTARINDGRHNPMPVEPAAGVFELENGDGYDDDAAAPGLLDRPANCSFAEIIVSGWPHIFVVAIAPITEGGELLLDYGSAYWEAMAQCQNL